MGNNYFVYKHTSPTNKVYIGITTQRPEKRWGNGSNYKYNVYFTRAINKYGWENFKHEILYENLSEGEAKDIEQKLIAEYKSFLRENGYNITLGGESGNGYHHTEEAKARISKSESGRISPMKGKHHTEESKLKISLANKGIVRRAGFKLSEETKKKISISQKGIHKPKPNTVEYKERMRAAKLGRKFSDIQKINHKNGVLRYHKNRMDTVIIMTDINKEKICVWRSQAEASRVLGIPQTTISLHVRNGKPYMNKYFVKFNEKNVTDFTC